MDTVGGRVFQDMIPAFPCKIRLTLQKKISR